MKTHDLLKEGFLDNAFIKNVECAKSVLLSTTDLSVITNIYGHLYKLGDLYKLLFEDAPQRIDTPAGLVNTGDIRAFTWMRYLLSPTAYWKPDKKAAYLDTAYCGGTPLALLGARNKANVKYNDWHKGVDPSDIDQVHKLDLFLGSTLSSTTINSDTGILEWRKGDGLIKFLGLPDLIRAGAIQEIRSLSGHTMAQHITKIIKADIINIDYYNDATTSMRHMIRQSWCWYGTHRCSNMILDYADWDKVPKDVDSMTEQLKGQKPRDITGPSGWGSIIKTGKI